MILRVKLKGQAEVARLLGSDETASLIGRLAGEIAGAGDGAQILAIEATAAVAYWALWRDLPVQFARQSEVPEHSRTFGPRRSPLTQKPFRGATPGNALLNYLYRAAESEMTIALLGVGLDPGIAIFHLDRDRRSSLALDAIEAIRPYVDCWLAAWLADSRFAKRDFVELPDGEIRITRPLTSHLAMSGPIWRRAATAVSDWLAQSFGRVVGAGGVHRRRQHHPHAAKPASGSYAKRPTYPATVGAAASLPRAQPCASPGCPQGRPDRPNLPRASRSRGRASILYC
jgi:hypothetical protein